MPKHITISIPDDEYSTFRTFAQEEGLSMSGYLRRAAKIISQRRLRFVGWDPILTSDGAPVTPTSAGTSTSPSPSGISIDQYKDFVLTWRSNGYSMTDVDTYNHMVNWAAGFYKVSEESVRRYVQRYPPDFDSPLKKATNKFLGLEE